MAGDAGPHPAGVLPADALGLNGTYNLDLFVADTVQRIQRHAAAQLERRIAGKKERGLYIYAAFQNVHAAPCPPNIRYLANKGEPWAIKACSTALHAPCHEVDTLYGEVAMDTYKVMAAMLTYLDYGIGNITAALDAANRPYLLAMSSDNGGPLDHATNAPLRGGKHTVSQ